MPPISGIGSAFGVSEESTFGTADTAVDNYLETEEGFESIEITRNIIEPASLRGRSLHRQTTSKGRLEGGGDLEFPCRFDSAWSMFLAHCVQKAFATTGAGPYTHTLDLGATPDLGGKGLTLFINRQGINPGGSATQHVYYGARPTAVELMFPEEGHMRAKAEMLVSNNAYGTITSPTYQSGNWIKLPSNATSPTSFFVWNGTSYIVRGDTTLRIEQPYETRYSVEDDQMLEPALSGLMEITMQLTVEALETGASSGGVFMDDYKSMSRRTAVFTVDGPTPTTEKLTASFGDCLITSPPDPHPQSGETQLHTLELKAYADGATSAGSIVLLNGSANPYAT